MQSKVVRLLEKALEAAQQSLPQKGRTSNPPGLFDLIRRARQKGHGTEAKLLRLAANLAVAALKGNKKEHHDTLVDLHECSCLYLDDVEEANNPTDPPEPVPAVQAEVKLDRTLN